MEATKSAVPSAALHVTARQYLGSAPTERLIERTTVPDVLASLQGNAEGMPALTWYEGDELVLHYSYADLLQRIQAVAFWFVQQGVTRGERVVVLSSNAPEVYAAHLALMSIGAVTVPVSNAESLRVLQLVVDKVRPCLLACGRDVIPELGGVQGVMTRPLPSLPELPNLDETAQFVWPVLDVLPDDPAVILFTSGTTSVPKGVCLSHYNLLVNAQGLSKTHNLSERRVHMCILPLFHANAFGFSMVTSLYAGSHVVLSSGLPGAAIWSVLREQRVNIISLVPETIRVLASIPPATSTLPDLNYVVSAAAPLPKSVAHEFMSNTGINIHQGYGLSECVNFAATVPWSISNADLQRALSESAVPSIGPALFGCEIDILSSDGTAASEGEEGEIVISGHTVMLGYWDDEPATHAALSDGYLRTGDLGFFTVIEGRRYFFVTGRKKEIIIRYGENFSPLAIEAQLDALRALGKFAVTGFANEMAGEEIGLYMHMPHTYENERKVVESVRGCSTRYRPRVIVFGNEPIPATPTGKVKRSQLALRFNNYTKRLCGNDPFVGAPV
ncbi:class I adenylate-forming enzyme family protein [Pseudomonas syringae]|uniref:class I adenylate-forming enzyme family protein n=1 Tax=Pseudomonas syringae TaxID=317 RepID=UPI002248E064|nr:class I adenylate-forming enzyme family protein [Pseudomonas syringae]UZS66440.1 acyl--CoA ligase [Pseudomonas syringae]